MNDDMELVRGSGNAFQDFGRENAGLEQARALLAARNCPHIGRTRHFYP